MHFFLVIITVSPIYFQEVLSIVGGIDTTVETYPFHISLCEPEVDPEIITSRVQVKGKTNIEKVLI